MAYSRNSFSEYSSVRGNGASYWPLTQGPFSNQGDLLKFSCWVHLWTPRDLFLSLFPCLPTGTPPWWALWRQESNIAQLDSPVLSTVPGIEDMELKSKPNLYDSYMTRIAYLFDKYLLRVCCVHGCMPPTKGHRGARQKKQSNGSLHNA